jgi:hypothetical protein
VIPVSKFLVMSTITIPPSQQSLVSSLPPVALVGATHSRVKKAALGSATDSWSDRRKKPRQKAEKVEVPPLWQQVILQISPDALEYRPSSIAHLLHVGVPSIQRHCRQLWPDRGSQYFLDYDEVCLLVYYAARNAKNVCAERMFNEMVERGTIDADFDFSKCDAVKHALGVIMKHRENRRQAA